MRSVVEEIEEEVRGKIRPVWDRLECGHYVYRCGLPKAIRRHCRRCLPLLAVSPNPLDNPLDEQA